MYVYARIINLHTSFKYMNEWCWWSYVDNTQHTSKMIKITKDNRIPITIKEIDPIHDGCSCFSYCRYCECVRGKRRTRRMKCVNEKESPFMGSNTYRVCTIYAMLYVNVKCSKITRSLYKYGGKKLLCIFRKLHYNIIQLSEWSNGVSSAYMPHIQYSIWNIHCICDGVCCVRVTFIRFAVFSQFPFVFFVSSSSFFLLSYSHHLVLAASSFSVSWWTF